MKIHSPSGGNRADRSKLDKAVKPLQAVVLDHPGTLHREDDRDDKQDREPGERLCDRAVGEDHSVPEAIDQRRAYRVVERRGRQVTQEKDVFFLGNSGGG